MAASAGRRESRSPTARRLRAFFHLARKTRPRGHSPTSAGHKKGLFDPRGIRASSGNPISPKKPDWFVGGAARGKLLALELQPDTLPDKFEASTPIFPG